MSKRVFLSLQGMPLWKTKIFHKGIPSDKILETARFQDVNAKSFKLSDTRLWMYLQFQRNY